MEITRGILGHPNPAVRRAALELLFSWKRPESLPDVRPLLEDRDSAIRARAAELVKQLESSSREK
jgi:HEAT repeat protein